MYFAPVAIRLRPLNSNEAELSRVWKVLPKFNAVTQMTKEGKALPDRVQGKNFFLYDKVFGEASSTKDVYDSVAKGIVVSACGGRNGTIFAYGQTSSGKTFTMQGSGTIQEGSRGAGGIVHLAANQIFDHITNTTDRKFSVRASFLEIYNEEVRDLLSDSRVLAIREDPVRGVFVEAEEEVVSDFASLLTILFRGDKSRSFASTAMNERSSRSHTIFRITIESKQATTDTDAPDGAIQVATLNLVDLAGSESVRHTGATGDRQVEGGMINRR
jgi:centromeric protein E